MKGYVQIYTGEGKGKTTAALGLALRAAGAGLRVFIGQFMKGKDYSELKALARFEDTITLERFGTAQWVGSRPTEEDRRRAMAGLERAKSILCGGEHDVVILDEILVALHYTLIPLQKVIELMELRPDEVELVMTGRGAPEELIRRADLVTEMRAVKHYHSRGVAARTGIEQ
jgi:cob(I)alamin adenosyltransferase